MILAVLQWNSDSGEPPIILLADDVVSARRAAVVAISEHLPVATGAEWVSPVRPLP